MKDNYPEINFDMEQIFSKEYEALSPSELNEIGAFVSSKEEFMQMRSTLMNVKTSFGTEVELEPRNSSKDDLMKMFNDKHGAKVIRMNTRRPFYMNPFVQVGIAAALILGIIYFYPKGTDENPTAMNEDKESTEMKSEDKEADIVTEEETTADVKEAEEMPAEESPAKEVPALLKDEYKADVPNVTITKKESLAEGGKFETAKKSVEKSVSFDMNMDELASATSANDSIVVKPGYLYSDAKRTSDERSKKGKEELKNDKEDLAVDGTVTTTQATMAFTNTAVGAVTGGIAVTDDAVFAAKLEEEKEKDKKGGDEVRTNTAGGYYHQPAAPADIKNGVSMKDKPALAEFLFTAL